MKRIVLLLAALGAFVYVVFFAVAIQSEAGWRPVMDGVSLGFGLPCLAVAWCFKELPRARAAVFSTGAFFLLIHPVFLVLGTITWFCMVVLASIFVAALLESVNEWDGWGSLRYAASSGMALFSASLGVLYVYQPYEDVPLWFILATQCILFIIALCAAPWGRGDVRVRRNSGQGLA